MRLPALIAAGLCAVGCGSRSEALSFTSPPQETSRTSFDTLPEQPPPRVEPEPAEPTPPNAFDGPRLERNGPRPPVLSSPTSRLPSASAAPSFLEPSGAEPVTTGVTARCEAAPPSLDDTLAALVTSLLQEAREARPFLRYVAVTDRIGEECEGGPLAVDAQRLGVSHLLNSLSAASEIVRPRAVDREQFLLRIDLRDYGWNRAVSLVGEGHDDVWEAVVAGARQAAVFSGPEAELLRSETGAEVPLLLAGDFVETAVKREDLYYEALGLPDTLDDLLRERGVTLAPDFSSDWALAVTTRSVVTRQDRLLARSLVPAPEGGSEPRLWMALDHSPESTFGSPLLEPFRSQADAYLVLFALPNGLPGYFAANGRGERSVVSGFTFDTLQDDFVSRVPVSCEGCHMHGVLPVADELRPFYEENPMGAFDARQVDAVLQAYPRSRELLSLVRQDSEAFVAAKAEAGLVESVEATMLGVSLRYRRDVNQLAAATELFLGLESLEAQSHSLPQPVRRIAVTGATMERPQFNAVYVEALCAVTEGQRNRPLQCPPATEL